MIAIARQLQETSDSVEREVAGDAAGFHQDEMFLILQEQLLSLSFSDLCFSSQTLVEQIHIQLKTSPSVYNSFIVNSFFFFFTDNSVTCIYPLTKGYI